MFYDSAIEELATRGHTVAIAVNNQREEAGRTWRTACLRRTAGHRCLASVHETAAVARRALAVRADDGSSCASFTPFASVRPRLRERTSVKGCRPLYQWLDRISAA
jgi:hypothetical protein